MASVHKDFHGGLSYGIQHVYTRYGEQAMVEFFRQVGREVYGPLSEKLRTEGLSALEEHWRKVFSLEQGEFTLTYVESRLVLTVDLCPAIHHLKTFNYPIADRFCEHTRIVNDEICHAAGYESSLEYDQEAGACIQTFWKREA